MATKIQHRGDTAANWASVNPVLSEREMVLETDTNKYKIGDGVTAYSSLAYSSLPSAAEVNTNKVTSLSAASTDIEYPSAKVVFDRLTLESGLYYINI